MSINVTDNSTTQINSALNSLRNELNELKNKKNAEDKQTIEVTGYSFVEPINEQDNVVSLDTSGKWEGTAETAIKDETGRDISTELNKLDSIIEEGIVTSVNGQTGDVTITHVSGDVPTTRKVNSKALSSDITLTSSDVGAVPTTRKVNNKALSTDITLTSSDVGARADTKPSSGSYFNGTPIVSSNGYMEVGRYIDFHNSNTSTEDYSKRIDSGSSATKYVLTLPNQTATLATTADFAYTQTTGTISFGSSSLIASGFITSNRTSMKMTIPCPRFFNKGITFTKDKITTLRMNIRRAEGGYIYPYNGWGNTYVSGGASMKEYLSSATFIGNMICVEFIAPDSGQWQNCNNNSVLVAEINSLIITVG